MVSETGARPTGIDSGQPSRVWTFAGCVLDERKLELKVNDVVTDLDRKPLEVLLHLLRHAGEVVTKDELAEAVWPGRIITDSNLTKTVAVMRAALGDSGAQIVKTVHGYGYRLMATVSVQLPSEGAEPPRFEFQPGESPPGRPQWRLSTRLRTGGQGEVWLAHHVETREARVFKFAEAGRSLTGLKREVTLNRLLREALPERDDYLRLSDWNFEDPPCFVEAEYVAAGNLATWAESRGGIASVPLERRLALLACIADAVAAAHGVGVLHKDLKPANVLIVDEPEPRVKLADFGSGGVVDPARLGAFGITRMGFTQTVGITPDASGTPAYLAPEVLAGQPFTTLSDVYALGVMLYQLVAGDLRKAPAPGWEKDVPDELLREDIAAAAAGRPAERLGDAASLAQRLRTLEQRRATRAAERSRELEAQRARRMRFQVRRLRAIAAVLVVATAAMATMGFYALHARDEARRSAATAEAVSQFLTKDLLAGTDPRQGPLKDFTVLGLLDRAGRAMTGRFAAQPDVAARVHVQLGEAYFELGEPHKAREHLEAAITTYGEDSLAGVDAGFSLLRVERALGEDKLACDTVRKIAARVDGARDAGTERRLGARTEGAICESTFGSNSAAIAEARAVVAEFEQAGLTASPWYERSLKMLIFGLETTGSFPDAEVQARKLLAWLVQTAGEHHLRTARVRGTLGEILTNLGRFDEAEAELQRALDDQVA